ncbi:MAG: histidine kinase dimerization/phospho-acceptor domain-containing protein [Candidatus Sulfotelmatobacter sp.]
MLRRYYQLWTAAVALCVAILVVAAFVLPQSFRLTALGDVMQCLLLFSGTISLIPQAVHSRGRLRLFWTLMTTGIALWFFYQVLWVYFEVWRRTEVPDLCAGDMILFLHIVPLMAALALRPHAPQDEYAARLRHLDFALLMVWWGYLYILIVIPWQYVVPDVAPYNDNLNLLYLIEKLAFLSALFIAWLSTKGGWKIFYASLFGACFTYAAGSHIANWAIGRHVYYTGSFYDIPLAVSMAWITVIGLWTHERGPQVGVRSTSTSHGVWLARLGMIAAFSLPLFAAWTVLDSATPSPIRWFRVVLTLAAAVLMGVMVFVRQRLLDRELLRLLTHSRESFAHLKRLQVQITESEKLASIGQLVGGAAHELNNPITAMLGYSDLLLLSKPLSMEQNELAARIGQHARRTKSLVASLLSFAKPTPAAMAPVDLNTLLRTAVKLSQPQWQALKIEVRAEFPSELLLVRGDSNQLLQVCVQIINDALHAVDECGSHALSIAVQHKENLAVILVADTSVPSEKDETFASAEIPSSLGVSACQGILRQHHGRILCHQVANAGIAIRVELPLICSSPEKSTEDAVLAAWEPQSFA